MLLPLVLCRVHKQKPSPHLALPRLKFHKLQVRRKRKLCSRVKERRESYGHFKEEFTLRNTWRTARNERTKYFVNPTTLSPSLKEHHCSTESLALQQSPKSCRREYSSPIPTGPLPEAFLPMTHYPDVKWWMPSINFTVLFSAAVRKRW